MAKHIDEVVNNLRKAHDIGLKAGKTGSWDGFSESIREARIEMEAYIQERTSCPK